MAKKKKQAKSKDRLTKSTPINGKNKNSNSKASKLSNKPFLLKIILVLSILGLLTSLYLVQNHYSTVEDGSACDFSEAISCSLVNASEFSKLLNVPVSIFGVLWFLILIFIVLANLKQNSNNNNNNDNNNNNNNNNNANNQAKNTNNQNYDPKDSDLDTFTVLWSIIGLLSVIYFIVAEVILKAICPFCTIVHLIVFIILLISIKIYKTRINLNNKNNKNDIKSSFINQAKSSLLNLRGWILLIVIINIILLVLFNLPTGETEDYTELAKCITENEVTMYGSFRCGICAKTRAMFDDAFEHIVEIECHPQGEDNQWELCQEKEITGTPTWIKEEDGKEIKRHTGFLSIDELKEFSECLE